MTLVVAEGKMVKFQSEGLGLHFLVTCRGDAVSSITATAGVPIYSSHACLFYNREEWKLEIFIIQNLKDTR